MHNHIGCRALERGVLDVAEAKRSYVSVAEKPWFQQLLRSGMQSLLAACFQLVDASHVPEICRAAQTGAQSLSDTHFQHLVQELQAAGGYAVVLSSLYQVR